MDHLPVEIILHILSFLPVADLIRVSRVNKKISELAGDQQLVRELDLRQAYTCSQDDLKLFLRPKGRCLLVHRLDMDCVYWFRPPFDTIIRMKNLNALHLRGIPLTLRQLHGLLTADLPLQELSIDWPKGSQQPITMIEEMQTGLCHLKFLCLYIEKSFGNMTTKFLNQVLNQCQIPFHLVLYCPVLEYYISRSRCDMIFTCQPTSPLPMVSSSQRAWFEENVEQHSTHSQVTEVVSAHLDLDRVTDAIAAVHTSLKALQILNIPEESYIDLRGISKAVPGLQRLKLTVVNSKKDMRKEVVQSISAFHHLTHLSLPVHILSETCGTENTCNASARPRDLHPPSFKRPRLGVTNEEDVEAGVLNIIINNCTLLTMLEIGVEEVEDYITPRSLPGRPIYWHSLKNIKKLHRLTHLALCNIPVTNGGFLLEIAVGCPKLEFLNLANLGSSGKCCYLKELTDSVIHMTNLVHFRLQHQYLAPATALFMALKRCQKLQRLTIACLRDALPMDLSALEHLIKALPSLILVAVHAAGTPQSAYDKLKRKLKQLSRLALVVSATNYYGTNDGPYPVPFAHRDMIHISNWMSGSYSNSFYHQDFSSRHYVLQLVDMEEE